LVFGLRNEQDIFWDTEFTELTNKFNLFNYTLTLSQPSSAWQGKKGRVTEYVESLLAENARYYICGSVEMVKDVRKLLVDAGVNTKSIHFEIY
jgi:NAD(P)H-flavin reductase